MSGIAMLVIILVPACIFALILSRKPIKSALSRVPLNAKGWVIFGAGVVISLVALLWWAFLNSLACGYSLSGNCSTNWFVAGAIFNFWVPFLIGIATCGAAFYTSKKP
ncbi:hypothetical protein BFP76_03430 [Amylibacter kogurei]|uniref:Uncharacterized protein n=1 Tax=Paramylibacter kogurei TaxID=1889778 RepID=A0A2G5K4E3_9RHOB|nr:hypothetical protein [Amylibacter kogurei]PIB24285.1 hypothetical protein BFP76_03430 [Amylibacter kogurei]